MSIVLPVVSLVIQQEQISTSTLGPVIVLLCRPEPTRYLHDIPLCQNMA